MPSLQVITPLSKHLKMVVMCGFHFHFQTQIFDAVARHFYDALVEQ